MFGIRKNYKKLAYPAHGKNAKTTYGDGSYVYPNDVSFYYPIGSQNHFNQILNLTTPNITPIHSKGKLKKYIVVYVEFINPSND